ncbi:Lrp/AsnC family transcriptional regulator [Kordiimonas aquimaris]|uniref:Lrp/AsnC family transcriptional regulator n=1 Tax=Kordiimonas aquimaris TaxID=707591 RepID=UPI0021D08F8F|nr:Lrp/AsnC family transcriptional regulator [Kordiimonas aquimaris]
MTDKPTIKLDDINRKILATVHLNADLSNQELAERVGLSPSACFQRTKALREAGYFFNAQTDMDLDRIFEHVLAQVEFTLESNNARARKTFEAAIEEIPEFMDCLRMNEGEYISFTCCPSTQALNALCDTISENPDLGVKNIKVRMVMERTKWYLGYPLEKLKWKE